MQQLTSSEGSPESLDDSPRLDWGGGCFRLVTLARARFLGELFVGCVAEVDSGARRLQHRLGTTSGAGVSTVEKSEEVFEFVRASDLVWRDRVGTVLLAAAEYRKGRAGFLTLLLVTLLLYCLAARCKASKVGA